MSKGSIHCKHILHFLAKIAILHMLEVESDLYETCLIDLIKFSNIKQ